MISLNKYEYGAGIKAKLQTILTAFYINLIKYPTYIKQEK